MTGQIRDGAAPIAGAPAEHGGGRPVAPSGEQVELVRDGQRAVVVEVGGALRGYTVDGEAVLDGYAEDEMCTGARGQSMIPWPNRLADGRYEFGGETFQLALSEPDRRNAIHGVTRWAAWRPLERSDSRVVMAHRLHPQPGYPFTLDCRIEYELDESGLTVRTSATNVGSRPCPYGTGAHPYLTVGTGTIDDAELTAPAGRYLPTDDRGIPTGAETVDGSPYDFRAGRPLSGVRLDHTFTDLGRDADGLARVELRAGTGRTVRLWVDEGYPYLELFTGDTLPQPGRRRRGLGVEPMSCAPNAFRTGAGLRVLHPGERWTCRWGLCPARPPFGPDGAGPGERRPPAERAGDPSRDG